MARKKPELIKGSAQDVHIVTLSGRGVRRVFVMKDAKRAAKRTLNAIHSGEAKRAECVTLRPWNDGKGFGRLGSMVVTPRESAPAPQEG